MGESYCFEELVKKYTKKLDERCKPLSDTYLDWPSASVNETVELPCPEEDFLNKTARRTCVLHSFSCNDIRPTWTVANYSRCQNPEKYNGLCLNIAYKQYLESKHEKWEYGLLTLGQLSYFQSLIVVIIALTIFVLFGKLRNARTRLHMNMFSAIMMQSVMWLLHSFLFDDQLLNAHIYLEVLNNIDIEIAPKLAGDFKKIAEQMFTRFNAHLSYIVITGLKCYFETVTFFWLSMEGWFLYEMICRRPLKPKTSIKNYVAIAWGVPVLVTTPWIIAHLVSSFNDVYWVKRDVTVLLIAVVVLITFLINLYFFLKISQVLYVRIKKSLELQQKTEMDYKRWVRSTLTLVILFGLQNLFYCMWFYIDETKPKLVYLQFGKIISSFQGSSLAFIYCFLNKEVQMVIKENLCSSKKVNKSHDNTARNRT